MTNPPPTKVSSGLQINTCNTKVISIQNTDIREWLTILTHCMLRICFLCYSTNLIFMLTVRNKIWRKITAIKTLKEFTRQCSGTNFKITLINRKQELDEEVLLLFGVCKSCMRKVVKYNLIHSGVQLNGYDGWQVVLIFPFVRYDGWVMFTAEFEQRPVSELLSIPRASNQQLF